MTVRQLLEDPQSSDVFGDRRKYGFNDDFLSQAPKQSHQYLLADKDAAANTAVTIIFAPTEDIYVHSIAIMQDGSSSAEPSDANTSVFSFTSSGTDMAVKTFNTNVTIADNTSIDMGTLAVPAVASGGRVEIQVENHANVNLKAVVVTIEYSALSSFPNENWKTIIPDGGSVTISDGVKGIATINPSDATESDADQIYMVSQKECYKFLVNKPIITEAFIQFTEVDTTNTNAIIATGLMNAVAEDSIKDAAGGPRDTYAGAVFYKVDGGTKWKVQSSDGADADALDQTTSVTAGGSTYQRLRIECLPVSATVVDVTFWIDGAQCRDNTTNDLIKHRLNYATATEMEYFLCARNGKADAETLNVDSAGAYQLR